MRTQSRRKEEFIVGSLKEKEKDDLRDDEQGKTIWVMNVKHD